MTSKVGVAVYLVVILSVSGYLLLTLWSPAVPPGGTGPQSTIISVFGRTVNLSEESRILLLIVSAGSIGASVDGLYIIVGAIGGGDFHPKWNAWYLSKPFVGAFFALIFYVVLRAGLFSPQATTTEVNAFGFVAIAALVGMFSEQALLKLKQVAEDIFTKVTLTTYYYSTEKVEMEGRYKYYGHVEGYGCTKEHFQVVHVKAGEELPIPKDCSGIGMFLRL